MLGCHSLCCFYLSFFFVTLVFTEPFTRGKFHHNRETASQTQRLTITSLLVSTVSLLSWLPLVTANYIFYVKNITTPKILLSYCIINTLNFSNCFVNSVVYSLRIPDFRQSLCFCFTRRQTVINRGEDEGRDNGGFVLTLGIEPSAISRNSRYLQEDFELESVDSKLWSALLALKCP